MRDIIKLVSEGKTAEGKKTGTFYTTTKNKKTTTEKFLFKKFDPRAWNEKTQRLGAHVPFKEEKIK